MSTITSPMNSAQNLSDKLNQALEHRQRELLDSGLIWRWNDLALQSTFWNVRNFPLYAREHEERKGHENEAGLVELVTLAESNLQTCLDTLQSSGLEDDPESALTALETIVKSISDLFDSALDAELSSDLRLKKEHCKDIVDTDSSLQTYPTDNLITKFIETGFPRQDYSPLTGTDFPLPLEVLTDADQRLKKRKEGLTGDEDVNLREERAAKKRAVSLTQALEEDRRFIKGQEIMQDKPIKSSSSDAHILSETRVVPTSSSWKSSPQVHHLFTVSERDHQEAAKLRLGEGAKVDGKALCAELREDDQETAKMLLDTGAEEATRYALRVASEKGDYKVVKLLLDRDVEATSWDLLIASREGHQEVVKLLLDRGVEAGSDALCATLRGGYQDVAEMLLDRGAEATSHALLIASEKGYYKVAELLLDRGVEADSDALYATLGGGYQDVAEMLLDRGAEATSYALFTASEKGYYKVVKLLLDRDVEATSWDLLSASREGHQEVVKLLLDRGVEAGSDTLNLALGRGHQEVVRLLLDQGVKAGSDVLSAASRRGHQEVVKLLLDQGVKAGSDALDTASGGGHLGVVKLLLDAGADVRGQEGRSALQAASEANQKEVVKLLLDRGAPVNESDPLQQATVRRGHQRG